VRLLPVGTADERGGAARREPAPDTRADQAAHEHQRLPLRHLSAHRARRGARGEGGVIMNMTRREFMLCTAGFGFSLLVNESAQAAEAGDAPRDAAKRLNAWASLGDDGTLYIVNPAVEMGQGSMTAIPRIIAEEIDADWARVVIVPAAPNDKIYGN